MSIWEISCYILAIGYACLILFYYMGWLLIPKQNASVLFEPKISFSILVPARNEEVSILNCLASIINQNYPSALFEIIVINDHSTDKTAKIVEEIIASNATINIRLIDAELAGFSGKKNAITAGISIANFDLIVLTDADCTRGNLWLSSLNNFVQHTSVKMIYAPVFFHASTVFEKFQSLEFAGLVGIGGAAIQLKNPNMCSAANLVFTKDAFNEVGGYLNNEHIASGDDEFLLHKIFKKYPDEVYFLKDERAIVYTSPNGSMEQLTQQRRRWVSKSTKYEERYITAILVGAYFFNLSMLLNVIISIFYEGFWQVGLTQLLIKMFAEGLILGSILHFFKRKQLLLLMPLVQPFHILYVIIIGIWANVNTYTWKERELK
jgi:cellulose synthase/poly-beta-1,6-N-acetylglucosamine synthase-like glycosyltransferase